MTDIPKTHRQWLLLYFKGVAMGAADVVPGISGGTIAFITGIYETLIGSISSFTPALYSQFRQQGLKACWHKVNGTFLCVLFAGIVTSVLSLAGIIHHLLETQPILIWGFFYGLILASGLIMLRMVTQWRLGLLFGLALGVMLAVLLTTLNPGGALIDPQEHRWFVPVAGGLALCAMILPGISGSFILLLLGMYQFILTALLDRDVATLGLFLGGGIIGLILFSRLLRWLLDRFHDFTLVLLTGFVLGALIKAWPWKYTISYRLNRDGDSVPFIQQNVWPQQYQELTGYDPAIVLVLFMFIAGVALPLIIKRFGE